MTDMVISNSTRVARLVAYASAALVLAASFAVPSVLTAVTHPGGVALTPPSPSGPHTVGRTELHLAAPDRGHPWVERAGARDVMVSVWYPAAEGDGTGHAPYLTPSVADVLKGELEQVGRHRDDLDAGASHANALQDAAADGSGPFPVVLYSPGLRESRFLNTSNIEELVSHGYVVAAMDHPYETLAVDLPDGRVLRTNMPGLDPEVLREAVEVRVEDVRLTLDGLAELAGGRTPDTNGKEPPPGLTEAVDMDAIGMFGHSLGGLTAAEAILEDDRIDAGMNLDGTLAYHSGDGIWADSTLWGVDRPFALLTAGLAGTGREPHHSGHSPDFRRFVDASAAPVLELYMAEGEHMSYTDHQWILPALAESGRSGDRTWTTMVAETIGTVDPEESVRTQRAYITAFFDAHLRSDRSPLLDGLSPDFPTMEFVGRVR